MSVGSEEQQKAASLHQSALDFSVEGMTCGSCAARVQRVLQRSDGVQQAEVNFATGRARVVSTDDRRASLAMASWPMSMVIAMKTGPASKPAPAGATISKPRC